MYTKVALVAIVLAGTAHGVAIQKRDGQHAHAPAAAPASGYSAPSSSYGAPAAAPSSSYGAPSTSYGAPAAAPASSYGAPAASYGAPAAAPASSYGAPAASYGAPAAAPASSYGAPATGYGAEAAAPAYGATGEAAGGFPPILPIVAAILGLIGLSLLFPAFVTVAVTGRRKRSAEEANPMYDLAERVNDIYGAVLESEECMEKIACELGAMTNTITGGVPSIVEPFVPAKYSRFYKQFKTGSSCDKIKCGKAF